MNKNILILLPLTAFLMSCFLFGCAAPTPAPIVAPTVMLTTTAPTVDGLATDVARAQAVAATLTAAAPKPPISTPVPLPTIRPSPSPTIVIFIPPARTPISPSLYAMVINHHTQLCLTIQGRDIVQASCRGIDNQLWQNKSGYDPRQFITKSGACLSFSGIDIVVSGAGCPIWTVRQWGDYLSIEVQNNPHPGPPHPNPDVLQYGIYFQIIDGGNCVDVDGWNHDKGGKLIHWPCSGSLKDNANQLWAYYQK